MFRIRTAIALLVAILAATAPGAVSRAASGPRIVVLQGDEGGPYAEALAGFRSGIRAGQPSARLDVRKLSTDPAARTSEIRALRSEPIDLWITLGSAATKVATREIHEVPIVAGMILNEEVLGSRGNATGVLLEFPLALQIDWLRRFVPRGRNVGLLFNPRQNRAFVERAEKLARERGLHLVSREVASPKHLPDALKSLNRDVDVIWGIPDRIVLSPETARSILLFGLRNRIPFVGLSKAWVDAGALYALDRDYRDAGEQCARIAVRILAGASVSSLPPQPPRVARYSVNLKTARHLGLDLPSALIDGASHVVR